MADFILSIMLRTTGRAQVCDDKVQAMSITVHAHCLRCVLLDQSLDTDIFGVHVVGTVISLASAITNLYVEVTTIPP